ncbi:MAG: hypothetical protein U5K43_12085 [Halofilum sp. (in: g-proteobacteria)]|nr:hypothetical protein [Halofilum sp. (in: g-proteobacteria)]
MAAYFAALGAGYMLLELALLQRAILFLGEPVVAAALVFALFPLGSGIGSAMAPAALRRRAALPVFGAIAAGSRACRRRPVGRGSAALAAAPFAWRATLVAAPRVPLAWALGRPVPVGPARSSARARAGSPGPGASTASPRSRPPRRRRWCRSTTASRSRSPPAAPADVVALAVAWRWTRGGRAAGREP